MNDIAQWEPPKGTWHITFTMWNGPYTVADEYVIPVPDNTLYSDQAYEVAKKIFPLGEFAEKIVIDFVPATQDLQDQCHLQDQQ